MSSLVILLLFLGAISGSFKPEQEFEVKQSSILNSGRSYTLVINVFFSFSKDYFLTFRITEVDKLSTTVDPTRYTIQNELLSLGKKLVLLEKGQPLYEIKHKLGHLYQK
jgi:hypothetical protein